MSEPPKLETYGDVIALKDRLVALSVALTTFVEGHGPDEPLSAADVDNVARIIIVVPPRPAGWQCWPRRLDIWDTRQ